MTVLLNVQVIDGYLSVVDVTFDKDDDDEEDVIGGWPLAEFSCRYCAHYRGVPYTPDFRGDDCLCYRDPSDPRMSGFNRAPFGYDTVWASALALNRTLVELRAHGSCLGVYFYKRRMLRKCPPPFCIIIFMECQYIYEEFKRFRALRTEAGICFDCLYLDHSNIFFFYCSLFLCFLVYFFIYFRSGSRVSQEDFSFKDVDVAKMIYRNMKNLSFRGLTGSVSFTSTGDRIPKLNVLQFQWDMETNSRCSLY